MTAEAGLRNRVLQAVRQQWPRRTGVLLRGNPASAATGPGHPDIDGVVRSRPIALEIKKAKGKPTPIQVLRLQDLRDAGCYAWIVRSPFEACEAVYWVAKGWTRPLSNEPLDLNAWLMNDPPKVEAEPFEPAAVDTEGVPYDKDLLRPSIPMPTEQWDTPEHQEAAAQVLGFDSAEQRTVVEEKDKVIGLAYTLDKISENTRRLDTDLRAVGDRVTLIYERIDTYTAVLYGIDHKLSQILGMIMEDPGPGEDTSETLFEVPTNGTVEAAETTPAVPPKRKRRSRAEMEAARAAELRSDMDSITD